MKGLEQTHFCAVCYLDLFYFMLLFHASSTDFTEGFCVRPCNSHLLAIDCRGRDVCKIEKVTKTVLRELKGAGTFPAEGPLVPCTENTVYK